MITMNGGSGPSTSTLPSLSQGAVCWHSPPVQRLQPQHL